MAFFFGKAASTTHTRTNGPWPFFLPVNKKKINGKQTESEAGERCVEANSRK